MMVLMICIKHTLLKVQSIVLSSGCQKQEGMDIKVLNFSAKYSIMFSSPASAFSILTRVDQDLTAACG